MRLKMLVVLTAGLLVAADDATKDAAKNDQGKLQGKWTVVGAELEGQKLPEAQAKGELVFKGNTYAFTTGAGESGKGTFKLDPTKKPKAMDAMPDDAAGVTVEEFYEVDGDNLKICLAVPGNPRPKEFKAPAGSGRMLFIYKRAKP